MSISIQIFDTNEQRAKAWANKFYEGCQECEVYISHVDETPGRWKMVLIGDEVDFKRSTSRKRACLFLAHGNDADEFEVVYPPKTEQLVIWYGGFHGDWKSYPKLGKRGIPCDKVYREIGGSTIPISGAEIIEILEYAQGRRTVKEVSCLYPPPVCSLLASLSACVQSELSRQRKDLKQWVKNRQRENASIPDSILDFDSFVTHSEAPDPKLMVWSDFLTAIGSGPGRLFKQEASEVCDSMRIIGSDKERFLARIEKFVESCSTDTGPSLDDLIGIFVELCWLEQRKESQ